MPVLEEVLERIYERLGDPDFQEAVWRAAENAEWKVPEILERHPYLVEMAREVEEAKRRVIADLEYYVDKAMASIERAGGHAYLARDPGEARRIVLDIVGTGKLVVFSKSMVAVELGLRDALEEAGNEVWETDLGELLVQLEDGKPMHTTAPAIHLSRERAARLVREKLGLRVPEDARPEEIVAAVRVFLRDKFSRADVGLTGANAVAAEEGSIVLVENEGNIRLVSGLPPVHIAVTGVEKILPNLELALKTAIVQAAYAGLYPPTYINVVSGPSSTADIEHRRVYGAHGPRETHVVLVDNGRLQASKTWLSEQLRCVRCGRCQWHCPVWRHTANEWGGRAYGGPMGVLWTAITEGIEESAGLAMLCLVCGRCDEVCPVRIPLSSLLRRLKSVYASRILEEG